MMERIVALITIFTLSVMGTCNLTAQKLGGEPILFSDGEILRAEIIPNGGGLIVIDLSASEEKQAYGQPVWEQFRYDLEWEVSMKMAVEEGHSFFEKLSNSEFSLAMDDSIWQGKVENYKVSIRREESSSVDTLNLIVRVASFVTHELHIVDNQSVSIRTMPGKTLMDFLVEHGLLPKKIKLVTNYRLD